jgi:hypothetical protein
MTDNMAMSEAKARAWITAFECEQALYTQFPIRLANGKSVPGVHVVCSCCNGHISGDRVHGRVIQSLPHVVSVSANGYCEQCNRMTHIDCRFRAQKDETLIEWLASNGHWQARELQQPTVVERITRGARRLVERFRRTK